MEPQATESEWEALEALKKAIREKRENLKLTQVALAEKLHCSSSFIAKLETLTFNGPLPSYGRTEEMERVFEMPQGALWRLVQAAKTEIDTYRLARRTEANREQRHNLGLRSPTGSFLPSTLGLAPATTQINIEAQAEIENIMPDLRVAMTDPTNRAMIAMWLKGLADKVRESNKAQESSQSNSKEE